MDGNLSEKTSSVQITGFPLNKRFSPMKIGGSSVPFKGLVMLEYIMSI